MAGGDDRFDGLYLNLAQQNQGIDNLLESFFGFLRRKTDFFTGASQDKLEESLLKVRDERDVFALLPAVRYTKARLFDTQKHGFLAKRWHQSTSGKVNTDRPREKFAFRHCVLSRVACGAP